MAQSFIGQELKWVPLFVSQGDRLKASREIPIATVFRDAPAEFLKMIVVHELVMINGWL